MAMKTLVQALKDKAGDDGKLTLGGFEVIVMDELRDKYPDKFNEAGAMDYKWFETEIRPNNFIYIRLDKNSLSFTFQNDPVGEVGLNGCQSEALIEAAHLIVKQFNYHIPCQENEDFLVFTRNALRALNDRTKRRTAAGVEGYNKET